MIGDQSPSLRSWIQYLVYLMPTSYAYKMAWFPRKTISDFLLTLNEGTEWVFLRPHFCAVTWWWKRTDFTTCPVIQSVRQKWDQSAIFYMRGYRGMLINASVFQKLPYAIPQSSLKHPGLGECQNFRCECTLLLHKLYWNWLTYQSLLFSYWKRDTCSPGDLPGMRSKGNCFLRSLHEGSICVSTGDATNK